MQLYYTLFVLFGTFATIYCLDNYIVPASQITGLYYLYNSTNGKRWTLDPLGPGKWQFPPPTSPCDPLWQGLYCVCTPETNEFCNITKISLSGKNLNGPVPPELNLLPELNTLDLSGTNRLNGTNLTFLCDLYSLMSLNLGDARIEDVVPSCIGQSSMLDYIKLASNLLKNTNMSVFCELPLLGYLDLESSNMRGTIPACFGNLSMLYELRMGNNLHITGSLPIQLSSLSSMQRFDIYDASLNGTLPTWLEQWKQLVEIELTNNDFSGTIPEEISKLSNLGTLSIAVNKLVGTIPSVFEKLSALKELALNDNHLSHTIPSMFAANLIDVDLANNFLTGSIPACFGNASGLQYFSLGHNSLSGTIPSFFRSNTQLSYLYLDSNAFTGTDAIFSLPTVFFSSVDLSYNSLSGTLPFGLTNYSFLNFYGRHNYFSGSFPAVDLNLFWLSTNILDLSYNTLTGTLPSSLHVMSFEALLLSNNRFRGNLDVVLSADVPHVSLQTLDVGNNGLTGSVPLVLFSAELEEFFAGQNCFSGSISSYICNATNLRSIALAGMTAGQGCLDTITTFPFNFSRATTVPGDIPPCIFQMPRLKLLSLAGNGIRSVLGEIPADSHLRTLDLSQNRISGSIPKSIKQFVCFEELELSYNHLTGTFDDTAWFVNDSSRASAREECGLSRNDSSEPSVSLQSNRLSGNIPDSFKYAANIDILDGNMFSCDSSGSDLPIHDPNKDSYVCGSAYTDGSMMFFTAVAFISTVVAACFFFIADKNSVVRKRIEDAMDLALPWKRGALSSGGTVPSVRLLHSIMRRYRHYLLLFLCLIWLVFVPLYLGLKSKGGYSTHTYQYGWMVSLGFLGTSVPGTAIFVLWMIFVPILVIFDIKLSRQYRNQKDYASPALSQAKAVNAINPDVAAWKSRYLAGVVVINIIVVLMVNGSYVYVVLTQPRNLQSFVVVVTSLFKTVWTLGVMNPMMRILNSGKGLVVAITVLNNLIIPVFGTILVDIECYQKLFFPPQTVQNDLIVEKYLCAFPKYFDDDSHSICIKTRLVDPSDFVPPFIYSGQCSNSLLTNYVPVYVLMFGVVNIFLMALQFGVLCYFSGVGTIDGKSRGESGSNSRLKLLRWIKANLSWLRIASLGVLSFRVLPLLDDDDLTEFQVPNCIPMYNLRQLGVNWVFGTLLLLTFGVAYPPLSIIIFVDLVLLSLLRQLCIHKHLEQLEHLPDMLKQWDIGFEIEMDHLITTLFNPKPVTSTLTAMFISLFVFDMITGSGEPSTRATVYVVVLVGWGLLVSVLYYYYETKIREKAERVQSTIRRYSLEAAVELAEATVRPLSSKLSWFSSGRSSKVSLQSETQHGSGILVESTGEAPDDPGPGPHGNSLVEVHEVKNPILNE